MKRTSLLVSAVLLSAVGCGIETQPSMLPPVPTAPAAPSATPAAGADASQTAIDDADAASDVKLITLRVEGMSCPTGCYPSVKEAIAKQKNVTDIQLAPQKESDVIDNPIVYVKYKGKLNVPATLKAISKVGFDASPVDATKAD